MMKTQTMMLIGLIIAAGMYAYAQRMRPTIPAAGAGAGTNPPDGQNPGGVVISAPFADWIDENGTSDSTGDPELDALINGYGMGDGTGAATL